MTHSVGVALEQHAHSLRELARALVGAGDADDVVQATAAAALANPHPVREPVAFLRHLLRVQAHRHRRGAARRRRREQAHAVGRDETAPPAEHALEQREAVAQLHQELMAVPQPHLGALLLRYFEELSPSAIAERLAVPLPTVKSRLQRGLELLREQLDRRTNRGDWRERFAVAFALPPNALVRGAAAGAAVPLLAVVAMKLTAVVFVGLAAAAWLVWPRDAESPSASRATVATPTPSASAADAELSAEAPAVARTAVAAAPAPTVARIAGRVTDNEGAALAGATITVVSPVTADPPPLATATTDGDGAFACDAPPGECAVRVTASHHVPVQSGKRVLAPGGPTDFGTIALRRGVVVRGRVIDRDGKAIVGTLIGTPTTGQEVSASAGWWWWRGAAHTDADGRFELDPLLPVDYRIDVPREQLLEPVALQLADGQADVEIELRVESASRQLTLRGRVVDEQGHGLGGAKVIACEPSGVGEQLFAAISGDDGAFTIRRLRTTPDRPVRVHAEAKGYDETRLEEPVAWTKQDLAVVVRPLVGLTLRVVDATGAPVPDFTLRIGRVSTVFGVPGHASHFAMTEVAAANGEHVVRDLRRSLHDVHVTPAGDALAASGVQRIEVTGPHQHHTVVLPRRTHRALHLRTPDGVPVAGAKVELCQPCLGAIDLRNHVVMLDRWTFVSVPEKSLLHVSGSSDGNGALMLDGPAATPLVLRVLGPGCLPFVLPIARLDGEGPLLVDCRRGGTLRVIARPAEVLGELASLCDKKEEHVLPHVWLQRTVGQARERVPAESAAVGQFDERGVLAIDGVPDGTWTPQFEFARERILLPAVTIADGAITEAVLDLASRRPVTIRGRVLVDGAPAALRCAQVERLRAADEGLRGFWVMVGERTVSLAADGTFVLRSTPGTFRLLLQNPFGGEHSANWLAEPKALELVPGASCEQTFTITTGALALRFVDREQRPVAGVDSASLRRPDRYHLAYVPVSDANGRSRVDHLETGSHHLVVLPKRFGSANGAIPTLRAMQRDDPDIVERTLLDLGPIVVAPGEPAEQTIVLPEAWFR